MCQKCLDAVMKHYPDLPESDYHGLLMGATSFPFGQPEDVDRQLAEARANTDGTLQAALAYADSAMEAQMRQG